MNAAEHIVEAYFRLVRGCFTLTDRKVANGNNRQLDLLAYHLKEGVCYHIEVGVTHRENWCPTTGDLGDLFDKKFFGAPPKREGKNSGTTDFEKGKSYWPQINKAYKEVGFRPSQVKRVWVCWVVKDFETTQPIRMRYFSPHRDRSYPIEILSLRDFILPALQQAIGTSNYDDEILRTLGFMKQRETQVGKT